MVCNFEAFNFLTVIEISAMKYRGENISFVKLLPPKKIDIIIDTRRVISRHLNEILVGRSIRKSRLMAERVKFP